MAVVVVGLGFLFFQIQEKKAFSSATAMTTAGTLHLLVVEAGKGTAEGLGSTCTISHDDDHHQW